MEKSFNLKKKKILITGASGGLGTECAKYLSGQNAELILVGRNSEKLSDVVKALPNKAYVYPCDFELLSSIKGVFSFLKENEIKLDGLVHAAGIAPNIGISQFDYNEAIKIFNINFFSFCELIKYCSKKRYMNNGSSILGISSISVQRGNKAQGSYVASKSAMEGYVRIAAKELVGKQIRINVIEPAAISTDMALEAFNASDGYKEYAESVHKFGLIKPEDLAKVIGFMLSEDAKYMTGLSIPVDSGLLYCSGEF